MTESGRRPDKETVGMADPMFDLELGLSLHGLCRLCYALGWTDRGSHDLEKWAVATEEPDGTQESS